MILFTGKGGVGKTSLAAASALQAATHGHRVALVSSDAAHSLGDVLGRPVGPHPVEVAPGVVAQEVDVLGELDRSWSAIHSWLCALLLEEGDVAGEELLVLPGLEELVALRAVREVEARGAHDLCILDCAPTASTLRMLRLPDVLGFLRDRVWTWKRRAARIVRPIATRVGAGRLIASEEVFDAFERLFDEIAGVRELLLDPRRTSARLVVEPARVVVEETRRAFAYLSLHGILTDAVLVNRLLPEEVSGGWFARWRDRERAELLRIEQSFPVPLLKALLRSREPIGLDALRALGSELYGDRDPADALVERAPLRFERRDGRTLLSVDLPCVERDALEVSLRGDELEVALGAFRRRIALPNSVAGRPVAAARLAGGVLEVTFEPAGAA